MYGDSKAKVLTLVAVHTCLFEAENGVGTVTSLDCVSDVSQSVKRSRLKRMPHGTSHVNLAKMIFQRTRDVELAVFVGLHYEMN